MAKRTSFHGHDWYVTPNFVLYGLLATIGNRLAMKLSNQGLRLFNFWFKKKDVII